MSGVNGKRAAAAGGLLYVASLVVVLVATRTSPEPKESAQKIVADLLEHRSEYAFAAYVAALQGPFLLLFAAGLGTTLAMGAAATAAALGLVGEGALAAAAYHGGLDAFALHTPLLLLGGLPLALLVLAAPPPRRLPFRVVTWGIAALFVFGSVGVVSASQSSGLEGAWFFGLLLFTVWVAVKSVRWLREQPE
jgi:hypothetical protein